MKHQFVVEWIYPLMPKILRYLYSKKDVEKFIVKINEEFRECIENKYFDIGN